MDFHCWKVKYVIVAQNLDSLNYLDLDGVSSSGVGGIGAEGR